MAFGGGSGATAAALAKAAITRWAKEVCTIVAGRDAGAERWGGSVPVKESGSRRRRSRPSRVVDACVALLAALLSASFTAILGIFAQQGTRGAHRAEDAEEEGHGGPVISFSGCAFAYPYQLGVARYISEHFHADAASGVRCAAHSAGFAAAFTLAADVPVSAHWEALQRARGHWRGRLFGPLACSTRSWMAPYLRVLEPHAAALVVASKRGAIALGYTRVEWTRTGRPEMPGGRQGDPEQKGGQERKDKEPQGLGHGGWGAVRGWDLRALWRRIGGITVRHDVITGIETLKELAYAVTLSQRILPFYRTPGTWKGALGLDGCFSAAYTIPASSPSSCDGAPVNITSRPAGVRIVRVSPCLPGDVSPAWSPPWYAYIKPPSREEWECMVEAGEADAAAARETLIRAGLKLRTSPHVVAATMESSRLGAGG